MTKLIVGLGNPDSKYFETRHNIGRLLVEFISRQFSLKWISKKSLKASLCSFSWEGQDVCLAYPSTYMNTSGEALKLLAQHLNLNIKTDLLVVLDDVAIPFQQIRLRAKGSSGGHNGLKSIEALLGSSEYARLRMGILPEGDQGLMSVPLEVFVLEKFSKTEQKQIPDFLERGIEACRLWLSEPLQKAMSLTNPSKSL